LLQCSANGPYIQEHLLRAVLFGSFNRNEPITCVPSSFVAVRIRDDAATADIIRNPQNGLECFGNQCLAETPAAETLVNGQPGRQNQKQIVRRQAAYIFLWQFVARNAGCGQREIAEHGTGGCFINGNIRYPNRDLLLIGPGVAPQIIVERLTTAVKALYVVPILSFSFFACKTAADHTFRVAGHPTTTRAEAILAACPSQKHGSGEWQPHVHPTQDRFTRKNNLSNRKPIGYRNHMVTNKERQRDRVFRAISNPTRREILAILRGGRKTVGGIAQNFCMSRPAISKLLRLLHHAGLVAIRKEGTASICTLDALPLRQVNDWLIHDQMYWTESLQSLKKHMEEEQLAQLTCKTTKSFKKS
jgi:DNA-binding transcriptional ArsR family regulator